MRKTESFRMLSLIIHQQKRWLQLAAPYKILRTERQETKSRVLEYAM
jgi:hypothetical protein